MRIAFLWAQLGPYHMDRLEAVGAALAGTARVLGIEVAPRSTTYDWPVSGAGRAFEKVTLFPDGDADAVSPWRLMVALVRVVARLRVDHLFVAGYEQPAIFFAVLAARLLGARVYVMLDSKFDDKPRRLRFELLKRLMMLPYSGGFASGARAAAYLRFLGLRRRSIVEGYDTLSMARIRGDAATPPRAWQDRDFLIVARFVPKKNLLLAIRAYAQHAAQVPEQRRRLRLCGAGSEEPRLRGEVERLGIADRVDFLGFLTPEAVAREYAGSLCLLLPSVEEQWGLVVNEALAFALPLIASESVGARDLLIATLVNGFLLDPQREAAWAAAMTMLATDEALWRRLSAGSAAMAARGDVAAFVAGVAGLAGTSPRPAGAVAASLPS